MFRQVALSKTHGCISFATPAACGTPPAVFRTRGPNYVVSDNVFSGNVEQTAGRGLSSDVTRETSFSTEQVNCAVGLKLPCLVKDNVFRYGLEPGPMQFSVARHL